MSDKFEVEVTDSSFDKEVVEKSKETPVIVDFWASWCMPCLMISPILEKNVEKLNGKAILAKVNVDENPKISRNFNIMSIPSVMMFKDGKVIDKFIGALPEQIVQKWISKNIK